ncbi:MAG: sensor histidine kinase, partial [Candidatus Aenigmatarchaeota archaeon]
IKKAGEAEMEKIYFDPILSDVIEEYRPKAEKKGIDITLDENIKESQMSVIGGDLLYALFSNILENSIQHSDCDKIKISKKQSQDRLTVIIEDDGIGIPDESKGKLSDMDFKEGRNAGSGLGMYLVKNIVDTYNGDLKIKDSELGGARFEVSLRLP